LPPLGARILQPFLPIVEKHRMLRFWEKEDNEGSPPVGDFKGKNQRAPSRGMERSAEVTETSKINPC
jgi:hypothetical protein